VTDRELKQGLKAGLSNRQIAANLGVDEATVRRRKAKLMIATAHPQRARPAPEIQAPAPLAVKLPPPHVAKVSTKGTMTAVIYTDSHFPNQHKPTLSIIRQITSELQPDVIVNQGDMLDCYTISTYDKNPHRLETLQDEVDQARIHLAEMRLASPKSRFVLLEGNHEDRLRRLLWRLEGPAKALLKLTNFREQLTWPALLGLDELGIEFYPYASPYQPVADVLPKWLLSHGTTVRSQSAYTARAELDRYGQSGSSGHTHRLGAHFQRNKVASTLWLECGCTCELDVEYGMFPAWQQGFVVLTFDRTTGAYSPELIPTANGIAMWRGKLYDGR
jgi:hypothetical protein